MSDKSRFGTLNDGTAVLFDEPYFESKGEAQRILELVQQAMGGAQCCCFYCGEVGSETSLKIAHVGARGRQELVHRECFARAIGEPMYERFVGWTPQRKPRT
jgi:hypothetical protein